jgi:hypothetical protein
MRIHRGTGVLVLAGALILSGCGIVGSSADPKPSASASAAQPSPSPSLPTAPVAGQCHNIEYVEQVRLQDDPAVPCNGIHIAETIGIGTFTGAAASGTVPLAKENATGTDAAAQTAAYADCAAQADKYLGHSWIHPMVTLRIILPDDFAWGRDQRWYRCDLYELNWDNGSEEKRTSSFKDAWPPAACFDVNKNPMPRLDCSAKHSTEFVGGFMLPASLTKEPKTAKELLPFNERCWKVVASYIGVSASKVRSVVGVWFYWQNDSAYWASGRKAAWCFLYTGDRSGDYVTGSAKGRKGKGL